MTHKHCNHCAVTVSGFHQRGVGLLEVLVALVVISFGVLGMAGLQLTGMKQSTNGFNRAKAVMLTENMATRMRMNRIGVNAGLYSDYDSTTQICSTLPDPYCQAYAGGAAERCDFRQLAEFDKFSVACGDRGASGADGGIDGLLPPGSRMRISCVDSPCTYYRLHVEWFEDTNASSESDAQQKVSLVQMRVKP